MSITLSVKSVLTAVQVASTACTIIGKSWVDFRDWRAKRNKANATKRAAESRARDRRKVAADIHKSYEKQREGMTLEQRQASIANEAFEMDAIADKELEQLRNATHEDIKRERRGESRERTPL